MNYFVKHIIKSRIVKAIKRIKIKCLKYNKKTNSNLYIKEMIQFDQTF